MIAVKKAALGVVRIIFSVVAIAATLGTGVFAIILLYWIISGGISEIFITIVRTCESFFQHDWKLAEVVLVLVVFALVIRKRPKENE